MNQLLYENSVSYQGHLIIPFIFGMADGEAIYSYQLLSELGHKGKFHKADNPAGMYSGKLDIIIDIAKKHLDENYDIFSHSDYFKCRYTYRQNLVIIYEIGGKYFYDHYNPNNLNNVAAPKIFKSEQECISWIKQGLDISHTGKESGFKGASIG
ncbi:MAG TPA: hypothetical protein V6D12_08890 [Candidatus Obscuribacterales bacterium]